MTDPEPLRPLLLDPELRAALEARGAHEPSPSDLARLRERLAGVLPPGTLPPPVGPGAPAPRPPASPPAPIAAAAGKLGIGLALAVAGAAWLARSGDEPAPPPSAPALIAPASPTEPAPPPAPERSTEEAVLGDPPTPPPVSSRDPRTPARAPAVSPTTANAPAPTSADAVGAPPEASLLARAHDELLRGAPADALGTATEHARAYPRGMLSQEREVIAIEALVALGRRDEARRRAAAFHRSYPGSSHADRVDRLAGDPPAPDR